MKKILQCCELGIVLVLLLFVSPLSMAFTRALGSFPRIRRNQVPPLHPLRISTSNSVKGENEDFKHLDITWSIVPFTPDGSRNILQVIQLRLASKAIRLDCAIRGQTPPPFLCPKGGKAVIEARIGKKKFFRRRPRVARFGITTNAGPSAPAIDESIRDCFQLDPTSNLRVGAIIYEFVDPKFRSRRVGELANEMILAIHAYQGCDFTILVADDNGSGKLVKWYERNGFKEAPKMQEMMGSPGGEFGITMISPTKQFTIEKWKSLNLVW
jgi:hypothetical protein